MQKKDREGTRSDPVIQAVQGNFDHLMGQIRAIVNAHNLMVSDLEEIQSALNGVNDDAAEIVAGLIQEMSHDDLDGVTPNQHHNKVHTHTGSGEGGTVSHDDLTGVSADDHHAKQHALNSAPDHTGVLDDAQIPAAIARDAEVSAAIAVHAAIEAAHGMELDDVTDVNAPAPSDGQVLTWDSTPGEWVPGAGGGSDGSDHNILDHADADTPPVPADGDVLTWDATPGEWIAAAPTGGGGGGGTPQPIEERSIVMWRDSDFSAQLRHLWDLGSDPAVEATDLTPNNMSVGFDIHADDDANSSTEDGGGLVKGTSTADPDYWGTTHAANSVLELDEGVYVWSAAFWFGGAVMDPEDYMTAQLDWAEDPTLISAYASNRSMPGSWGGDHTMHSANVDTTYQFRKDGILFVPSGGAKYILSFSPQFADPAMYCYHVSFWLGRADAMGAATATTNEEHIFPMSTAETLVDGDQAPTFFMPFAGELQWVAVSGVARSTDIDVDLLLNGVSVFTGTLPVAPTAGGRGTKVIPTTTAVADGDELTINLSGSNGDGRLVAYVSVVPD